MTEWITFDPVISTPVSLLLLFLAAGVIFWKEYTGRRISAFSVLAVLLATLGLAGIFLRP